MVNFAFIFSFRHRLATLACLCLGLAATAQNAIVTDVASLQIAEGGFGTIKVRLQSAIGTPLTVTVAEVDGGAENLYVSTSCRFWLYLGGANWSQVDVGLFDLQTPATVDNFLAYVASSAYENTFVHRKVQNFVVQGGGFRLNEFADVVHIPTLPPVINEPVRSNVRATLAMAKVGGDPNSATSEWFFNVADNSTNLDFQNGGFTAFGQVLDNGMAVVDAINALPTFSYQGLDSIPYYSYTQQGGWNPVWLGDIEVLAGRQLLFDANSWNLWYEVRIHAAPDVNNLNGVRRIRFSAPGLASREVVVTEIDNAVGIVFQEPIPAIPENGSAQIWLKLAAPPHGNVAIAVQRVAGDPDLAVQPPATVSFSTADWNTFKAVTFTAADDPDAVDGEAIFRFSGNGVHPRQILVHEADDDLLGAEIDVAGPIVVPEGGTATFRVRLTAQPLEPFVLPVVWQAGDPDLDLATVARFHTPLGQVDVELLASEAPYAVFNFCQYVLFGEFNGVFFHSILDSPALLEGGLFGYDQQGPNYFRVNEFASVPVDYPTRPNWRGTLAMNVFDNGYGQEVVASHWYFNTGDNAEALLGYPVFGQVVGSGLDTLDQIAALPLYDLESYLEDVFYNEPLNLGGVLAGVPLGGWDAGAGEPPPADPASHLVFAGVELLSPPPLFTPDNWNQWQEVTLRARIDDDHLDGEAIFALFVPNGEILQFTAIEADRDLGIVVDANELGIPEGTTGQLGVRLSRAPLANVVLAATLGDDDPDLALVAGGTLEFTPQNWDVWQYVEIAAALDNDTEDGETTLTITQAVGEDFIVNAPVVRVYEIDRHARLTFLAGAGGQTLPAGDLLVDTVAGLPLPVQAIPGPGFALLTWQSTVPDLLEHPRLADNTLVAAVDGATLTAVFGEDVDGDALPDVWELQFVDDPTRLAPNADPNRDGRTTYQNFLDQTHPLLLEIELAAGWNLLGLSAIPQDPDPAAWLPTAGRSEGVPQLTTPVAWEWHPVSGAYRLATAIEPAGGYWIHATIGGILGILVQPEPPAEQLELEAGWNLVTPPSPAWTGPLAEVFGDAIVEPAYGWNDGQLVVATQVAIKQPLWVFAPTARVLTR